MTSQHQANAQSATSNRSNAKPVWVTINETIRISGLGRTRLYELLNNGTLKSIKLGGKRLVAYASIEALGQ
jgi:predicted DNA-binding transcriptional regulator AlpA